MALNIVIMAAGKGTRMKSALPKVLHRLGGTQPIAACSEYLRAAAARLAPSSSPAMAPKRWKPAPAAQGLAFVRQVPQLGTGHAVQQAVPALDDGAATTLILNGDVPLIRADTARALARACGGEKLALLTIELADATGYGRILRDAAGARARHRRAQGRQPGAARDPRGLHRHDGRAHRRAEALGRWRLKNDNAQREYYLTDIVAMAVAEGVPVVATQRRQRDRGAGRQQPGAAGRPGARASSARRPKR